MKKSDKKHRVIIRAVIFVILFFVMFAFMEAIFHDRTQVHTGWAYVYQEEIDVLILGSSQVHYAIDAKKITDETGLSVVDVSSGAQSIKQTYYNLVEILEHQEPELVVIETYGILEDTLTWMEANGTLGLVLAGIDDMEMGYNKLNAAFSILKFEGYPVFHIMREAGKTQRLIAGIKDLSNRIRRLFADNQVILDENRGYMPNLETCSDETYIKYKDVEPAPMYELTDEALKYTDKIIELCEEKNIPLEFVKTPLLKRAKVLSGQTALENYFEEKGYDYPMYNLMDEKYGIELGQEHYCDYNHMNHAGAEVLSQWFINHFTEILDK